MTETAQTIPNDSFIRIAGGFALVSGIVSAVGAVFLIGMFIMFATPSKELGMTFGLINDICVAIQYLLVVPVVLALFRILSPYKPNLIAAATLVGMVAILATIGLQLMLIFGLMPFEKQVIWVSIAILLGIGSWLVVTGIVAKSTEHLPNSMLMSAIAVPYFGYPIWAFWLGRRLLGW